ncbi:membrane protein insertase YidC [Streptacidiphilus sp. PB12-B1b]|uniref:membrane protein insertase YidC n=1 Tax=Streptacidiphilus sp. PB12-B1b TaxID=2705012 RepID=UPI0015FDAA0B|nr:membrane protein insertase YidC [Streptacidiphilus sp. PB12-B1b]QMU79896.1 membrane protein insertase YidC [Streptacidiphilus sp. PB12-B1b]
MTVGFLDSVLSPLYTAVSWIVVQFHAMYSHVFLPDSGWAWGLSIVTLTVVIRACMIPLTIKQTKSMRAMQALQPKLKAIQERYKGDRQRLSEETMKVYKEAGVNPAGSCLPLLIQSPFFMALYGVLRKVADNTPVGAIHGSVLGSAHVAHIFGALLSATFVGAHTTTSVKIVTGIMIAVMCSSQFLMTRMMMTKNVDLTVKTPYMQQQKMMMYVLPIIYIFFGINMPVGVLVYMVTTNLWTLGQQFVIIHQNPTPGSVAHKARLERLKAQGKLNADGTPVKAGLASLVKGGEAPAEPVAAEAAPVRRQQPKRQTKAQRQSGGSTAGTAPADAVVETAESVTDSPVTPQPTPQAKKTTPSQARGRATTSGGGAAQGGQPKRANQPGKRSPQPAGQRPKKKS